MVLILTIILLLLLAKVLRKLRSRYVWVDTLRTCLLFIVPIVAGVITYLLTDEAFVLPFLAVLFAAFLLNPIVYLLFGKIKDDGTFIKPGVYVKCGKCEYERMELLEVNNDKDEKGHSELYVRARCKRCGFESWYTLDNKKR